MFYYICGDASVIDSNTVVIDCSGVGYCLTVSGNTLGKVSSSSGKVKLFTYLSVKEDGVELFGFHDTEELALFKLLISVSGVGPKAAMSILTSFTPASFALTVSEENAKKLSVANGVGVKTAQRIILELKDKVAKRISVEHGVDVGQIDTSDSSVSDAKKALLVLGYTTSEISSVFSKLNTAGMGTEDIIKEALKRLMR